MISPTNTNSQPLNITSIHTHLTLSHNRPNEVSVLTAPSTTPNPSLNGKTPQSISDTVSLPPIINPCDTDIINVLPTFPPAPTMILLSQKYFYTPTMNPRANLMIQMPNWTSLLHLLLLLNNAMLAWH